MTVRVLDLFSGIGGFSLGLEWAGGFETVGFCEIEPFPRAVLSRHWPGVWIHDDIRTLSTELVRERCGRIDLICGGFPCQDVSSAGKGAGIYAERSGLVWELLRIVEGIRPPWLLLENVPALRTRGADDVLARLEELGYSCWPLVVGSWAVGAPHKRDRVWVVGRYMDDANSVRCDEPSTRRVATFPRGDQPHDGLPESASPGLGDAGSAGLPIRPSEPGDVRQELQAVKRAGNPSRWPARRGERQHEWEAPRLVEPGVGGSVDGLSSRLARRRREQLKALGNAVVPQVVCALARAMRAAMEEEG